MTGAQRALTMGQYTLTRHGAASEIVDSATDLHFTPDRGPRCKTSITIHSDPDEGIGLFPTPPRTRLEIFLASGGDMALVRHMTGVVGDAERRCRERDLQVKRPYVWKEAARRYAALGWWYATRGDETGLALAQGAQRALESMADLMPEPAEAAQQSRIDSYELLMDDPRYRQALAEAADRLMADLKLEGDPKAYARRYQYGYTDDMRARDFQALTRLALSLGFCAIGIPEDGHEPSEGRHYGAESREELAVVSLGILWQLLCEYRPTRGRRQSPRAWVQSMFFPRLESLRRNLRHDRWAAVESLEDASDALEPTEGPERLALELGEVRWVLSRLNERERAVVRMTAEGLDSNEIANAMGLSQSATWKTLERARRKALGMRGDGRESWS